MKKTSIAAAGALAVLSLPVLAEDMPDMKKDGMSMENRQIKEETKQAPVAKTKGTVKAIDTRNNTITLAHEAVPALQWPAMTMAFNATPEQLAGLKIGDRVEFEFRADGMKATIVSIKATK